MAKSRSGTRQRNKAPASTLDEGWASRSLDRAQDMAFEAGSNRRKQVAVTPADRIDEAALALRGSLFLKTPARSSAS